MSDQAYANPQDPYWISSRGATAINLINNESPPLAYQNRSILYADDNFDLYFNGVKINGGGGGTTQYSLDDTVTSVLNPDGVDDSANVSVQLRRTGDVVNMIIQPYTHDNGVDQDVNIVFDDWVVPDGYVPNNDYRFPWSFRSQDVYVGSIIGWATVTDNGAVSFYRDVDADPSRFTGVAGWSYPISLTWITADDPPA